MVFLWDRAGRVYNPAVSAESPWRVACESAELAVECAQVAESSGVRADPALASDAIDSALEAIAAGAPAAVALARAPSAERLAHLADRAAAAGIAVVACVIGHDRAARDARAIAADLGLIAVGEMGPLVSAMALAGAGATRAWTASTRGLPDADRVRLAPALIASASEPRGGGKLVRLDGGHLGWTAGSGTPIDVGEPRDATAAIHALRSALAAPGAGGGAIEIADLDAEAVTDVIFGPPRALSDPASKAALRPYGVPVPTEELCASPSRAAGEAARIGFPVRIALASPDLRVWDQPDLAVDGVDNAARVRDVFRQIMALAHGRAPEARLLGVTVTATTIARALLHVRAEPLRRSGAPALVVVRIGFADAHGLASDDTTATVLPAPVERIEAALARLAGAPLLLDDPAPRRRDTVGAIASVLLRLAAFVRDRATEIAAVEINPLALLVGGGIEVREACVTVGDAFERSLDAAAG